MSTTRIPADKPHDDDGRPQQPDTAGDAPRSHPSDADLAEEDEAARLGDFA